MFEDYSDILDVKDICSILRIGKKTAYRLLQTGEIPCRKIGRNYKVTKKSIIQYLDKN